MGCRQFSQLFRDDDITLKRLKIKGEMRNVSIEIHVSTCQKYRNTQHPGLLCDTCVCLTRFHILYMCFTFMMLDVKEQPFNPLHSTIAEILMKEFYLYWKSL